MLPPLIQRPRRSAPYRTRERGVTMALVALAMVAIVAMAALSIDIGTLYQASAEAQRAADAGALAAARVISLSGITGDPANGSTDGSWNSVCGAGGTAALVANTVAQQNLIGGAAASKVTVNYSVGSAGGSNASCVGLTGFAVNPVVTVYVQQAKLPTFFALVFSLIPGGTPSSSGVSATATAEVFNPSDSSTVAAEMIPVRPRCVKPWIVPNSDPIGGNFVVPANGSINNGGISQLGGGAIGESFNLTADCEPGAANCNPPVYPAGSMINNPPQYVAAGTLLQYVPALVAGNPVAVPSCAAAGYQAAIAGCDQTTVYACGTPAATQIDLSENPVNPNALGGDTSTAVQCLINNSNGTGLAGQDTLNTTQTPPFPFQIQAGSQNPLVKAGLVGSTDVITSSNSIVTIPIYDSSPTAPLAVGQFVTIVGFLQVFINYVDSTTGNLNVTVLNVAGCSNNATATPISGTSPVPIRLITPP